MERRAEYGAECGVKDTKKRLCMITNYLIRNANTYGLTREILLIKFIFILLSRNDVFLDKTDRS